MRNPSVKPLIVAMLVVVALTASCQVLRPAQPAVMYRGGPQRAGVYDTEGVPELTGVKWKFETGGEVWSSPVAAAGVIYFGSDDDHLYAVDANSGEERWEFKTGDDVRSSAAIAGGIVYFDSFDGYLYAVDAKSGQEKWKFNMLSDLTLPELPRAQYDDHTSSPAVVDGVVYVGSRNPRACLYAVDAETGQEKWRFKPQAVDTVRSSPAVAGDTIYFGGDFGQVYALDIHTGEQKWVFKVASAANYAPAVGDDGTVYVGSKDTHLYALDGQTGEQEWKINLAGVSWVTSDPAIAGEMVYAGTSDGHQVHAVQMDTGQQAWSFMTGGWVWSSPAVAGGVVYVGSGDRHLYAIDAQTGEELWSFETERAVYASPLVADDLVYVGSTDGNLYALY
jgi:outer membrane protein assembly factor BamB